jgi:hypothetical protein
MPQELIDFKDNVTQILNYGKYQQKVLIEGTPTWTGKEGEGVWCYLTSATAGWYDFYTYYYINSAWRWVVYAGAT